MLGSLLVRPWEQVPRRSIRTVKRVAVLAVLVLVNLPAVHDAWVQRQLDQRGRTVTAVVLDARTFRGTRFVDYRLPRTVDPAGHRYSARLDERAFRRAEETHRLPVLVVPGQPGTNRPLGALPDRLFLVVALAADGVLVLVLLLAVAVRRRAGAASDAEAV